MPTHKYYNGIPIEQWIHNATTLWGIPLHPSGELPIIDFMTEDVISLHDVQQRFFGQLLQVSVFTMALYPFIYNAICSVKLILTRQQLIAGWCCLLSASCGIFYCIFRAIAIYVPEFNCRVVLWCFAILKVISILCHAAVIQYRAYIALRRKLWVIILGSLLNLGHIANGFIFIAFSFLTIEPINGCVVYYATALPYIYVVCNIPFNAFCFSIFIYVAYSQYRRFGHDSWKHLTKDSFRTMLLALACDVSCDIIIFFQLFGTDSQLFFFINWPIILTLLMRHSHRMYSTSVAHSTKDNSNDASQQTSLRATITTLPDTSIVPIATGHRVRFRR
ncbi:hypothetical protein BDF22DRAFT_742847 [Syncephalis plumigaleata]|nr:hypothetical protein BDF22DRAFT_742847 [Syncephalis plumigaleata]